MTDVKMVAVNGVRYRPEDAPKAKKKADDAEPETAQTLTADAQHKMRSPAKSARK